MPTTHIFYSPQWNFFNPGPMPHHPHFYHLFVTNLWSMPTTHINGVLEIYSQCPPLTHIFFICFLQIHGQCLPPTFFYSPQWYFTNLQPMPVAHIFYLFFYQFMANARHPHFYSFFSNLRPMPASPQPPHNTTLPTHIYPPGVAPPSMCLVGSWPSQLYRQPSALQQLGPNSCAHL